MPRDVRRWTQALAPTLPYLAAILAVRSIRVGARRAGEDTVRRSRRSSAAAGRPDPPGEEAARLAARPAVYSVGPVERAPSVGAWRSLVARIVRDDEVGGSNPLAPTSLTLFHPELAAHCGCPTAGLSLDARVEPDLAGPENLDLLEERLNDAVLGRWLGVRV